MIRCAKDLCRTNRGGIVIIYGQVDRERRAFANLGPAGKGQDVLRGADQINAAAAAIVTKGRYVIDGRRAVDARIKAGTLAIKLVHMGQRLIRDCGHAIRRFDCIRCPARQLVVGLAGAQDRVVQFNCGWRRTTDDTDWPTDGVHALVERCKDLGIATVDDVVVNRQNRDGLCRGPVVGIKADVLAQCHGPIAVGDS